MNTKRLAGKIALITGASSGIGKATALLFAREGATVVINYRTSRKEALVVVREIEKNGAQAFAVQADVAKRPAVRKMVQQVVKRYKRIDILINNAGTLLPKPFSGITPVIWSRTMDANLTGVFNCIQEVIPYMKKQKGGKIVNTSSISAIVGSLTSAVYSASKAGADGLIKTLAQELGKFHITVNSVAPGPVNTDLLTRNYTPEMIQKIASQTPLGRIAKPEDIAQAMLFFASSDSDFITGQTLIVDGGRIIR